MTVGKRTAKSIAVVQKGPQPKPEPEPEQTALATAEKPKRTRKPKVIHPPVKGILTNGTKGKKRGGLNNPPGGRPQWAPQRKTLAQGREVRLQTVDEAWDDAKALVRHYVAIGYPQDVIAKLVQPPCNEDTLRKHFRFELENGKLIQNARVAGTAYAMAVNGSDGAMTRFWLRTQMGWKDNMGGGETDGAVPMRYVPGDETL